MGLHYHNLLALTEKAVENFRICNLHDVAVTEALTAVVSTAGTKPEGFRKDVGKVMVELLFNGFQLFGRFFRETLLEVILHNIYPVADHAANEPAKEAGHGVMV